MSRNGKIHTKKRQFRQMPVLAFLNQRLFLQPPVKRYGVGILMQPAVSNCGYTRIFGVYQQPVR